MTRLIFLLAVLIVDPAQAGHLFEDRDLHAGQALYGDHCASCHGVDLEGQRHWQSRNEDGTFGAPPHDESGHTWHHDSQMLFSYTKLGGAGLLAERGIEDFKSGMPAFGSLLSDDQIWEVLAYIQSTWPEEIQKIQAARSSGHD